MNVHQIIENTTHLSPTEKALIAHCLIHSLDARQDVDADGAWADLAEKRYAELASGEVEAVSWEDIRREVTGRMEA
uniref:Putative addiction module component, TIGR02574 family n=1 Tax=Candidatus Kentrum sp. DK TaxID=2126562 RepID=A0A450SJB3_9GAMM|nr:MAG: putative addiction module component, TIGR02574 family [Candidatus Kentron sp. DK]VFJ53502.1 MAG: putative addiction module component, TIGR02574 family [Candidatus Kentron sp. DK]